MFIVIVFMLAFGVSTHALLFPNQDFNGSLLGNLFLPAYFIMSGDDYTIRDTIIKAISANLTSKYII